MNRRRVDLSLPTGKGRLVLADFPATLKGEPGLQIFDARFPSSYPIKRVPDTERHESK